jgi:hypothetical protein
MKAVKMVSLYFIPVDGNADNSSHITNAIDYEQIRSFLANAPCKSILFLDGNYAPVWQMNLSDIEERCSRVGIYQPFELSFEGRNGITGYLPGR